MFTSLAIQRIAWSRPLDNSFTHSAIALVCSHNGHNARRGSSEGLTGLKSAAACGRMPVPHTVRDDAPMLMTLATASTFLETLLGCCQCTRNIQHDSNSGSMCEAGLVFISLLAYRKFSSVTAYSAASHHPVQGRTKVRLPEDAYVQHALVRTSMTAAFR